MVFFIITQLSHFRINLKVRRKRSQKLATNMAVRAPTSFSCEASTAARRHRRRVRWLKPLGRVAMLEKAGYSEERIYRMLMESSSIAQSRRLCLRAVSLECAAA
ncbi:hypothetical protein PR002_g10387 [Phytophthora rubi]|uniref:Uncharacterized protein n=1 Tax=Phytophthora rubi TaxID=129364 RepID=A0A6A3MG58_9STRA|nr:hypothetical protein PR002_g10387 [Phytophthora rubi]